MWVVFYTERDTNFAPWEVDGATVVNVLFLPERPTSDREYWQGWNILDDPWSDQIARFSKLRHGARNISFYRRQLVPLDEPSEETR